MSTKTTFKRIALATVAALGFGVLTSVAPAQAAGLQASSISIGTIPAARVGVASYVPVTLYFTGTVTAGDSVTVNAQIASAPISGGVANAASALYKGAAGTANDVSTNTPALLGFVDDTDGTVLVSGTSAGNAAQTSGYLAGSPLIATASSTTTNAASSIAYYLTAAEVAAKKVDLAIKITPDVAGTYTVLVSTTNGATTKGYTAGDVSTTFSITPGAGPSAIATTVVAGGSLLANSPTGALVKVSLTDAAGNPSALSGNEVFNVTTSGNGAVAKGHATGSSYTTTSVVLGASDFVNGTGWVKIRSTGTAAETISLVLTGSGTLPSSISTTRSFAVSAQAGSTTSLVFEDPSTTSVNTMNAATVSGNSLAVTALSTSQTWGFTPGAAPTATQRGYVLVTDTAGDITGKAGATYDLAYSLAAAATGGSITIPATFAEGDTYTFAFPAPSTNFLGITSGVTKTVTATARTNSKFTISPNATFIAAPGAAIALTATLADQFGAARASQTVTITTSGRNNPVATTAITDASGKVTFTTADASTSTTALTDTVTFSASGATPSSVTINYANTAVGSVTVTGGNTTASVNALTNDVKGISVGSSTTGAEAGAIDIIATVKDALGNALAGVPVTFTVTGTTAAFTSTTATVYSGTTGTATGKLYAWTAGTYTYTVAAGGKTTTGTATFGSIAAGNTRVVSATVSGNVVTGKATDRFGNPVKNAVLYAVTSGAANIGGAFVKDGTTASDGTVSWVVTGSGDVTVTAVNPADPAGTTAYQTSHLAGNATAATATVAAVAYGATVAGTATTAEKNVGASFAPAGVASVKVSVDTPDTAAAAADAAAEATDAANAATDAANAAAEAADAATAAAQDAADAVAALSTQVSEMVNALKKQITALTNLVIKIQKKVRA
jgi:hypothetical protein